MGTPRTPRWVALEQANGHDVSETIDRLCAGHLDAAEAFALVLAYGEDCARRAHDLARHAAEYRARRRLRAAGVPD